MAEAEKMLAASSKGGFFRSLFGSSSNKEEVAETFVRASNCFKMAKAWNLAGSALEKAAEAYAEASDMQYEVASKYSDAAKAYKNTDPDRAIAAYDKACSYYSDSARFQQCARIKKDVGEMYEGRGNNAEALKAFTEAADFYEMDNASSNADSMRIKVAAFSALAGKYEQAATMYEKIAENALGNKLLKYGAREHLLRAGLCRLCMSDVVGAQRALERYDELDPSFSTSREGRLLEAVVRAVDEGDVEEFSNQVYEYDSLSRLDQWKTSILLKIKNNINVDSEDLT